MKFDKTFLAAFFIPTITILILVTVVPNIIKYNPYFYGSRPYFYESAPNGVYDIYITMVENGTVFATLATDAGDLHGFWAYDNTIWQVDKFFTYYFKFNDSPCEMFKVRIEDNIIVSAWQE